jgi:hypothetical protein
MLHLHRAFNFGAVAMVVALILALVVMSYRSPLVIVTDGQEKHYYQPEHKSDSITEKDVVSFVKDFLVQMLNWNALDPDAILKQVAPLVTPGLSSKIQQELFQRAEKDFKGKKLSEAITNIQVQVTEKEVLASFDKVLRIDGMPLVVPTQMEFNIIRGSSTKWNPIGLYVNGLVEHEGTK